MSNFFLSLLNLSITASYIALAAMVLRFMLKKYPKWISCLLWALVAVRLLVPFTFESRLSLIPDTEPVKAKTSTSAAASSVSISTPAVDSNSNSNISDIPVIPVTPEAPEESEDTSNQSIEILESYTTDKEVTTENPSNVYSILSYIWIDGAGCMLAYSVISYLRVKKRVRVSIRTEKNIYICDDISTPFILGIIKPRIFLPSALAGDELEHIINHEKAHLKRCDHLWKPLGFLLLALHWFNPVMWVSYILLCRDIELACDEKVLNTLGTNSKKHYSETLLTFSSERRLISACPLAFGEVGVKGRIKNILNYKKPAFWVTAISLILCVAVGLCFLTNPVSNKENNAENTKTDYAGSLPDILPADCITDNYILYTYTDATNSIKTAHIKLYPEDNSFEFMINPLSSYLPTGKYIIDGKKLILKCDSYDNVYTFKFLDSYTLEFIQDESTELPEYKYSEEDTEPSPPFWDRSCFAIEGTKHKGGKQPAETTIPYTYEEIVENIINAFPWESDDGSAHLPDFLPHASYMYLRMCFRRESLSEVGYTLIDLDKNGVDELVISAVDSDYVYDVYTITDSDTVHLFSSGERYAHYLYENGYIEKRWSGSAAMSGHDFMRLSNGKLEFIERITLDAYYAEESGVIEKLEDAGNDNTFFKSTSRNTKNYVHISEREALELIDAHQNKAPLLEFSLIPLSDYKHGDIPLCTDPSNTVNLDIDGDGKDEKCVLSISEESSATEAPLSLWVYDENANLKGKYKIPDITIDTTRDTATYMKLTTAGGKLYLYINESSESTYYLPTYELTLKDNKITCVLTYLQDTIDYDIDGDGYKETLSISSLPIYPYNGTGYYFSVKAETHNTQGYYYNEFELFAYHKLHFEQKDGKLYVVTTTLDNSMLEHKYEVSLKDGNIVLTCGGVNLPYFNDSFSYIIDQMRFDIDGDGKKEDVAITPGPTSGLHSMRITAKRDGKTVYETLLTGPALDFQFEKDKDGKVYLAGTEINYISGVTIEESKVHKYDIRVNDSDSITLTENGVHYGNTQTHEPLPSYFEKVVSTLKAYEEGYNTHNIEMLNACFDHLFIDPDDKELIDDLINTVIECKIESVKFLEKGNYTVKFHVTYVLTYNDYYLGVGNRQPGYNLISADFIFKKVNNEYLISSMDLESASHNL